MDRLMTSFAWRFSVDNAQNVPKRSCPLHVATVSALFTRLHTGGERVAQGGGYDHTPAQELNGQHEGEHASNRALTLAATDLQPEKKT